MSANTFCAPSPLKRIASIHDMSAYGRCALSVILPVLSAMGHQCLPLPTAALSTHTGGFTNMAMADLTNFLGQALLHWQEEGIDCHCLYSGFLASDRQIETVKQYIAAYPHALAVVDPVLGDNGEGYQTCTPRLIEKMKELIRHADIITPNVTEACMLLDKPYRPELDNDSLLDMLKRLAEKGPGRVVITGIHASPNTLSNAGYNAETGEVFITKSPYFPVHYPGTGDIYASVLIGSLLKDISFKQALQAADTFTSHCIELTYKAQTEPRQGVLLEQSLPLLWKNDAGKDATL